MDYQQALDFFVKGGVFMIPLGICSVVSLMIIIERGFALARGRVISSLLENSIDNFSSLEDISKVADILLRDQSSLSRLIAAAVKHSDRPKVENSDAVQTTARHEVLQLERGLVILEIIVGIAPLLGLLGTVAGLIGIFSSVGGEGLGSQGMKIALGISEALNTTVAGLVIAIPSLTFWSYYNKKIENLAAEMEALCGEFLTKLYRGRD